MEITSLPKPVVKVIQGKRNETDKFALGIMANVKETRQNNFVMKLSKALYGL